MRQLWLGVIVALSVGLPPGLVGAAVESEWPGWRGPERDGISPEAAPAWGSNGPAVLWRAAVGKGFSSFAVAQGRVYTMGNEAEVDTVFCLDAATGGVLGR